MKTPTWRTVFKGATLQRDFEEIKSLLVQYVKEETVGPFKNVGRYLLFGILGSILVGFGAVMLLLALLRFLQWFPVLDGSLSWIPYLAVAVAALVALALTLWRIMASVGPKRTKASR